MAILEFWVINADDKMIFLVMDINYDKNSESTWTTFYTWLRMNFLKMMV